MGQMVIGNYTKTGKKLDKDPADREIVAKFAEEHIFSEKGKATRAKE